MEIYNNYKFGYSAVRIPRLETSGQRSGVRKEVEKIMKTKKNRSEFARRFKNKLKRKNEKYKLKKNIKYKIHKKLRVLNILNLFV